MLLCLQDHPTQYDPPLWRAVRARASRDVQVWYSVEATPRDAEIQRVARWDNTPEADSDYVPRSALLSRLESLAQRPAAILVTGWKQPSTVTALAWARARGVPVIASTDKTLNEPSPRGISGIGYTLLHAVKARMFDAAFTTGVLGRQQLASVGVDHARIVEGLYPVDIAYWRARSAELEPLSREVRARAGRAPTVVLAVCKLSERESPLFVLESFAALRRTHPDAFLVHVGDGPLRSSYEARVRALGLERHVWLAGYVPYRDLAAYYRAADVFVHLAEREPWGISVLEAMACERPVVATTSVGAAADLVVPGVTGGLGYCGDPESIARAIAQIDERGAAAAGQRAADRVTRFDVTHVASALLELVDQLAVPSRGRPLGAVLRTAVLNEFGRWSP